MDEGFIDSSANLPQFEEQDLMVSVDAPGDEDVVREKDTESESDEMPEEEV